MAEYHAKYSAKDIKWFMDMEADGIPIPESKAMPELFFDAQPFWTAFTDLNSSRQSGFGMGAIPYSEISSWLDENDIVRFEERQRYRRFIGYIDSTYMSKSKEVSDAKGNKK